MAAILFIYHSETGHYNVQILNISSFQRVRFQIPTVLGFFKGFNLRVKPFSNYDVHDSRLAKRMSKAQENEKYIKADLYSQLFTKKYFYFNL